LAAVRDRTGSSGNAALVASTAPTIPTPQQVFAIPPAMRDMLRTQVINRSYSREQRLQALVEMIFDRHGLDLQYDADATFTVSEIWQQRRANCLAFTLMFVALAREAGIQARVQEVGQVVSWYQDQAQGLVYSVGHVNAGVGFAGRFATVDLDRNVLYDRRGPLPISQARALAHFYNNRGAERMASGDLVGARAFFDAALAQDAASPPPGTTWACWKTVRRYRRRAPGIGNGAATGRPPGCCTDQRQRAVPQLGMVAQAQALEQRLQSVQREDPFAQYMLGAEAERAGRLDRRSAITGRPCACTTPRTSSTSGWRGLFPGRPAQRADRELLRAQELGGARSRRATRPSWTAWPAGAQQQARR
jgi:hypothetical protein